MFKFHKEAINYNLTITYWLLTIADIYSLQEWPPLPYTVSLNLSMSMCMQGTMPHELSCVKLARLNWHKFKGKKYKNMRDAIYTHKWVCRLKFMSRNASCNFLDYIWLWNLIFHPFFFFFFKLFGFLFEEKTLQRESLLFFLLSLILLQTFFF